MKKDQSIVWQRTDPSTLDLSGTRVAIVGGTGGIGRALSRLLASRGASVMVVGQRFRDAGVPEIEFLRADLSLMNEAVRIGTTLPAEMLDIVIFTTGILAAPERQETADGLERDLAISFLSRLVILREIALRLGIEPRDGRMKPRVFIMGCPGTGKIGTYDDLNAEKSYSAIPVHMNTVAGNEMLVLDAAKRYPHATFFGLNAGLVKANIRANLLGGNKLVRRLVEGLVGLVAPSAESYAERLAPLVVSADLEPHSGAMFDRMGQPILPSAAISGSHINAFLAAAEELADRAIARAAP